MFRDDRKGPGSFGGGGGGYGGGGGGGGFGGGGGYGGGGGRDRDRDRDDAGGDKFTPRGRGRRRVCRFCADTALSIDYKDTQTMRYFLTDRGKIVPRRISGNCAKHQRSVTVAIKRGRIVALLPFTTS